jgi:hypothetical protein
MLTVVVVVVVVLLLFLFVNFNSFVVGIRKVLMNGRRRLGVCSVHFLILRSSFNFFSSIYSTKRQMMHIMQMPLLLHFAENADVEPKNLFEQIRQARQIPFSPHVRKMQICRKCGLHVVVVVVVVSVLVFSISLSSVVKGYYEWA